MLDETNQDQVVEANPEIQDDGNPDVGTGTPESRELNDNQAVESPATDEFEQLRQQAKQYQELQPEFTRRSQELADLRRQNEQQQQALAALSGHVKAQTDPVEAKWQEYTRKQQDFDIDGANQALREWNQLQIQQAQQQTLQQAIQAQQVAASFEQAKALLGNDVTPDAMANFHAQMTPEDIANAMLVRQGRYEDVATKRRQEQERKARQAQALNSFIDGGEGHSGTVPGGFERQPTNTMNDITFMLLPQSKKKAFIEGGGKVINNATGQAIDIQ